MDKNIVLIGFMGSGKSSIAQALGGRLNKEVVSTDALIEARERKSIHEIFQSKGEAYFRHLEHQVIKDVSCRDGVIIDCGGGVPLRKENLKLLKANGIVFYLEAKPEVIYERIKHETHRPLLKSSDPLGCIQELYTQRLPLYQEADYTIDANGASIEGPIKKILNIVK